MLVRGFLKHVMVITAFPLFLAGAFSELSCTATTGSESSVRVDFKEKAKREVINPDKFREIKIDEAIEKQVNLTYSYLDDPAWEKNEGQEKDSQVLYYTRFRWGYIAVTTNEVLYYFYDSNPGEHPSSWFIYILKESYNVSSFEIQPIEEILDGVRYSYYFGNDPSKWIHSVKRYRSLLLKDVAPGVDLELRIKEGRLEKIIHTKDPSALDKFRIVYEKQTGVLLGDGTLEVGKVYGSEGIYFAPPVLIGNLTGNVTYVRINDEQWGIKVSLPAGIKPDRIDIKLTLADRLEFRGEAFPDVAFVLSSTSIYIAVTENVPTFVREPGLEEYFDLVRERLHILRFDRDLKLHSKVCVMENGISKEEEGGWYTISHLGIKYSSGHGVYVYGEVYGESSIPAHTGYSKHIGGGRDIFLIHLNEDLSRVDGATFLGGEKDEELKSVYISSHGVYVVGLSGSQNFPAKEVWYSDTRQGVLIFAVLLSFDLERVISGVRFSPTYYNELVGTHLGSAGLYICIQGHYEGTSSVLSQVFDRMSTTGRAKNETIVKDIVYLVLVSPDLKKIVSGMIIAFYKGGHELIRNCEFQEIQGGSLYILGQIKKESAWSWVKFLPFVKGGVHSVPRSIYSSFIIKVEPSLSRVYKVVWVGKNVALHEFGGYKQKGFYAAGYRIAINSEGREERFKPMLILISPELEDSGGVIFNEDVSSKVFILNNRFYVLFTRTYYYKPTQANLIEFTGLQDNVSKWNLLPIPGILRPCYLCYFIVGDKIGTVMYVLAETLPADFNHLRKGVYGVRCIKGEQPVLLKFLLGE